METSLCAALALYHCKYYRSEVSRTKIAVRAVDYFCKSRCLNHCCLVLFRDFDKNCQIWTGETRPTAACIENSKPSFLRIKHHKGVFNFILYNLRYFLVSLPSWVSCTFQSSSWPYVRCVYSISPSPLLSFRHLIYFKCNVLRQRSAVW